MLCDKPVSIVLDTDMGPDCDDAGALAILHGLADRGEARILGITHCTSNMYGPGCIDAINRYCGRSDIPVGTLKKSGFLIGKDCEKYNRYITENYSNVYKDSPAQDAVSICRKVLSEQTGHSVVMISIGPLTNLALLLESKPDENSGMCGYELIGLKAKELVSMAGQFETDETGNLPAEWNVLMDIPSAQTVFHRWPTPVVFCGWETGDRVITGKRLMSECEAGNPIKKIYELFTKGEGRSSWDLITAVFAVRGECGFWELSPNGMVSIDDKGVSHFKGKNAGSHRYLINKLPTAEIEQYLDSLLLDSCLKTSKTLEY